MNSETIQSWIERRRAVRAEAVLALHEPFEWSFGFGPVKSCRECVRLGASEEDSAYPCATVRAIETPVNDPSLSTDEQKQR